MNRIRIARTIKGLSQTELSAMLGVRQNTLSSWETERTEPDLASLRKMAEILEVSTDYLVGATNTPPQSSSGVLIPVVDYEEIDAALAKTGDFFGLRIKGSSMEPRMREGDVVIVRKQDTAESGETVVVLVNGDSATVKIIKYGPDGITLLPTNPSFDPIFYSATEVDSLPVRVIGKVVELRAKY